MTLLNNLKDGYYIGMMSGTSLDGLDAVICQFEPEFKLIATHTVNFSTQLKEQLLSLCQPSTDIKNGLSELEQYAKTSVDYAKLCVVCVQELLEKADVAKTDIIAIGCHGQTVRHRPELQFTLQLLEPNLLAEHTGIPVISDFRMRDMAVGGQGAPLAPAFHQAFFGGIEANCVLLNLGGIANITVLPIEKDNSILGYDTGPANLLLDAWCFKHTGNNYDNNGEWAHSGDVNRALLKVLRNHDFFKKPAPKSTGREDFHIDWLEKVLQDFTILPVDVQSTLVELTTTTVADAILDTLKNKTGKLYVCGGGAYNGYLLSRLAYHLPDWTVTTTEEANLAPTWVEGVAFAWLARQHELGLSGNLPSVTGARKQVILGIKCF